MSALLAYHWPGNIRQLVNALRFAEAICEQNEITVHDLPQECTTQSGALTAVTTPLLSLETEQRVPVSSKKEQLAQLLNTHKWNISAVAKALNISRPTLYRWLDKYDLQG